MKNGADETIKNNEGKTASEFLENLGYLYHLAILIDHNDEINNPNAALSTTLKVLLEYPFSPILVVGKHLLHNVKGEFYQSRSLLFDLSYQVKDPKSPESVLGRIEGYLIIPEKYLALRGIKRDDPNLLEKLGFDVSAGKLPVKKLKEVYPPQQFAVALQAAVGGKVIARETIRARRKDVTAPLYGGDVTRKKKLLKKQKKGKKRLEEKAEISVPAKVFLEMFRTKR